MNTPEPNHMLNLEVHRARHLHVHILCVACTVRVPDFQHHTIPKILLVMYQMLEDIWRGIVMTKVFQNMVVAAECGVSHIGHEDVGEIRQGSQLLHPCLVDQVLVDVKRLDDGLSCGLVHHAFEVDQILC